MRIMMSAIEFACKSILTILPWNAMVLVGADCRFAESASLRQIDRGDRCAGIFSSGTVSARTEHELQ